MKHSIKHVLNGVLAITAVGIFIYVHALGGNTSGSTNGTAPTIQVQSAATPATDKTIRIGWTAWADAEFVTKLARRLLHDRLGYHVDLVMSDIGIQYQGVANGDLDVMLMAWLPTTHRNYWKKVSDKVLDLGPLYINARLGWVVPDYVPAKTLDSIADLKTPAVRKRLNHRIYGIDPGSGLMQVSQKAMVGYGLTSYDLVASSGAGMTAALKRAIHRHRWVVATAWSPHWIFQKWHLRYLKDPKHLLGGREQIHAVVRHGFYNHFDPQVTGFLTRMYIPMPELEQAMLQARDDGVEQAVTTYIKKHPGRVEYWIDGQLPKPPMP